ncbi:MAG: tetratricopeptide repeat protein [Deltaproteobacteria bacterium]|nr:tetratricopeptide repeat protein [Deltaproteobacteria bacterium]
MDLDPVPALELSGAEAGARQQLEEKRSELDALLADSQASQGDRAEAFGELGLLYVTYEFLEAAQVCFRNAAQLAPEEYRWPYLQAYLNRARGQLEEARGGFERALELEPSYLPATLRLGQVRLELGDLVPARNLFEQALEQDSSAVSALEGLGKVAAAEGEMETAVERFQQALALQPSASSLHYALGQAYRDLGDLEQAQFHLERRGDASVRIADPLLNALAEVAQSAQFFLVQGAEALDDSNYEAAAAAYSQALERDEENLTALRGLGFSLEKLGDVDGALVQLQKGALVTPPAGPEGGAQRKEKAEVLRLLAGLLVRQGRDEEAIRRYGASLELADEQPSVLLELANALARQGRFPEALERYDRLLELQPGVAALVLEKRATVLVNLGRGEEAVRDFERALEAAPGNARVRLRFAEALEFLGDPKAAAQQREIARETIQDGPQKARLALVNARHLAATGEYSSAIAQLREALEQDPSSVEARFQLAAVLGHTGEFEEAIGEFRGLLAAQPRHGEARRGLTTALILGGRYGEARVELQEGMRLFPRDSSLALLQIRLLATSPDPAVRDGGLALEVALRLYAERQDAAVRQALALAHAAAGQHSEAVALQSALVSEARAAGRDRAATALQLKLDVFETGRAWTARNGEEVLGG